MREQAEALAFSTFIPTTRPSPTLHRDWASRRRRSAYRLAGVGPATTIRHALRDWERDWERGRERDWEATSVPISARGAG